MAAQKIITYAATYGATSSANKNVTIQDVESGINFLARTNGSSQLNITNLATGTYNISFDDGGDLAAAAKLNYFHENDLQLTDSDENLEMIVLDVFQSTDNDVLEHNLGQDYYLAQVVSLDTATKNQILQGVIVQIESESVIVLGALSAGYTSFRVRLLTKVPA